MGAIFAVIPRNGAQGVLSLAEEAFRRAAARSPYRGVPAFITLPQGVLGIQALGEDASLGAEGPWHVALHGWISNWEDLAQRFALSWPPTATPARRFAIAYAKWGEAFLKAARGEFSAIAVDIRDGDVSAIRGHLGTKPLFHTQSENLLVIATEIRQAMAGCDRVTPLNKGVLIELLAGVSLAHEDTCWQGVNRVMAAHVVHFIDGARRSMARYWLPLAPDHYPKRSLDDLADELRGLLFQAVERSLPDCKFAVAMSGGLDSTTIWGITTVLAKQGLRKAQNGIPISMVFPDDPLCDESKYIDAMLEYTGSVGVKINASGVNPLDFLPSHLETMDTPAGGTLHQVDLIVSQGREYGASVLLVGVGGDEWFGGSFHTLADDLLGAQPIRNLKDSLNIIIPSGVPGLSSLGRYMFLPKLSLRSRLGFASGLGRLSKPARNLVASRLRESNRPIVPYPVRGVERLYKTLLHYCGGETSECVEQRGASLGMDLRAPLLDADLVKYTFSVNPRNHLAEGQTKHLLRRGVRGLSPESVRLRKDKTTFDTSLVMAARAIVNSGWNPEAGVLGQEGMLDLTEANILVSTFHQKKIDILCFWDLYCVDRFVKQGVKMIAKEEKS